MNLLFLLIVAVTVLAALGPPRWGPLVLRACLLFVVLVPYAQAPQLLGVMSNTVLAVHPVTWVLVVRAATVAWRRGLGVRAELVHYRFATAAGVILVASGIVWTVAKLGRPPGVLLVDQVIVPLGLLLWARSCIDADESEARTLPRFLVAIAVSESLLAVTLAAMGRWSVWLNGTGRVAGTLDGPLTLALLLASCVPLTVVLRSTLLRVTIVIAMAVGVLTTQSRTGLVVVLLGIGYVIFAGHSSIAIRAITLLVAPVGILFAASSSLASGVASRFADDFGSANLRSAASEYFWSDPSKWLFSGHGVGASYQVGYDAGLHTSFESAFLMYSVDFGLVATALAFGLLFLQIAVAHPWRRPALNGSVVAGLACVVFAQGYSSVATESAAGPLLWFILGLAAGRSDAAMVTSRPIKQTRLRAM